MTTAAVRDAILNHLKKRKEFRNMLVSETNGFHFSAADVAAPGNAGETEIFRIAVIRQNAPRIDT